jgi:hypothetical protein
MRARIRLNAFEYGTRASALTPVLAICIILAAAPLAVARSGGGYSFGGGQGGGGFSGGLRSGGVAPSVSSQFRSGPSLPGGGSSFRAFNRPAPAMSTRSIPRASFGQSYKQSYKQPLKMPRQTYLPSNTNSGPKYDRPIGPHRDKHVTWNNPNWKYKNPDWKHHHHKHRHHFHNYVRFYAYPTYYAYNDYAYDDVCLFYYKRWQATGERYWWRRYMVCIDE